MHAALMDPSKMASFIEKLAVSELIVPVYRPPREDLDPSVFNIVEYEGRKGVAVYTSIVQFAMAAPDGGPCVQMTGRRLASGWDQEASLLLNPGGSLGIALDTGTVDGLSGR